MPRLTSLLCLLVASSMASAAKIRGPLATYVAKPDASYQWRIFRQGKIGPTQFAELRLTSQTWKKIAWKHQLFVVNPSTATKDAKHALLFVTGGRWKKELEEAAAAKAGLPREASVFATLAEQVGTPVAILLQVPHQPMFDGKFEDGLIAFTFEKFMRTGDQEWPLLLPMVKSAVRGMDASQEFLKKKWSYDIKTFTVTGASKRGWTTWLTGAVDPRATAIAPMVIDVLNMSQQMRHQKETWGALSYKINDYSERNLTEQLGTKQGKVLRSIVDPYSYRALLKQPKLIMIGTNDHYWPLDALNLYWKDLVGPKYILYVPNNRHGLSDLARVAGSLAALHQYTAQGRALPRLTWKFSKSAGATTLTVASDVPVTRMQAWRAHSKSRDFRNARWTREEMSRTDDGYATGVAAPDNGYSAVFGEAVYDGKPLPFFLSTNVQVIGGKQSSN